jgi:hypothetical protein
MFKFLCILHIPRRGVVSFLVYLNQEIFVLRIISIRKIRIQLLGSNPAPPQHTANSVSPEVGSHLGWHCTVCWPLRGSRGTQYAQKNLKIYREKKCIRKM